MAPTKPIVKVRPIPRPKVGENRQRFLSRCIPIFITKGNHPQQQAIAMCESIFENRRKTRRASVDLHVVFARVLGP